MFTEPLTNEALSRGAAGEMLGCDIKAGFCEEALVQRDVKRRFARS